MSIGNCRENVPSGQREVPPFKFRLWTSHRVFQGKLGYEGQSARQDGAGNHDLPRINSPMDITPWIGSVASR